MSHILGNIKGADMGKTAFLFPGQGAQKRGMGQDFYEAFPESAAVYQMAEDLLNLDIRHICFEEDARLHETAYTQAAMVTTGIAMLKAMEKTGLKADVCAGLSLGEYEAIYAAGALSAEDAIYTGRQRGLFMEQAVPAGQGAMAAVLMGDIQKAEQIIESLEGVWIANYNCPGQIVLSGYREAVVKGGERLKAAGARRVVPLQVSGPFHSPLLKPAALALKEVLDPLSIHPLNMPYVANYTGKYVQDAGEMKPLLEQQVYGAVRFSQSLEAMLAAGVDTFIEIGPGRTLSNFVKKCSREAKVYAIETVEEMEQVATLAV